ncbi:uncharacterized protein LOC129586914 isoform X2 [Paramacrobiotus metropolitanus]|nr:uncharacterized protein LOC129586914 isoform X2 [Paramacrobiotus metropolitanus]
MMLEIQDLIDYMTKNWFDCRHMWSLAYRHGFRLLGNNTNNFVEAFFRTVKAFKITADDAILIRSKLADSDIENVGLSGSQLFSFDGGDIDEDKCFVSGSDELLTRLSYDVYSLRSCDADVYDKVAIVLHDMAGVEIPPFVLQILKISRQDAIERNFDRAQRLNFEIDNKILKCLQAMHRAQMCDRVRGFDSKLGKVLSIIYRHFTDGAREISEEAVEDLIPDWPNTVCMLPAKEFVPFTSFDDKKQKLRTDLQPQQLSKLSLRFENFVPRKDSGTISHAGTENSVVPTSSRTRNAAVTGDAVVPEEVNLSALAKKEGVEYGMMFDFYAPEKRIFSVYMHPNMDYTTEPKETPVDPDNVAVIEEKDPDNPSPLWKQVKRAATHITRSLRGNPKYFVSPQDLQT